MSSRDTEFDMQIDILHALEDFLDVYDNHSIMVVTEAIANAIDVNASEINTELFKNQKNEGIIKFHNNGPPMNKTQFDNYHVLARSSKSKGSGIGFAGIGAKVYLAAWGKTIISTESIGETTSFASEMYVKENKLKAKYYTPKIKKRGTSYQVLLKPRDYNYLEKMLSDIIVNVFNPAILAKLKIKLNNIAIQPWNPLKEFHTDIIIKYKNQQFPMKLIVAKDDISNKQCNIQYHVSGKIITTKIPEWIYDVKPIYQKRFHVYVDAMQISDQLNLNKTSFKAGSVVRSIMKEIDRYIFKILEKNGYVKNSNIPEKWESNELTKFFEKLFKDPKFSFLNPEARGGIGPGTGKGSGGTGSGGTSHTNSNKKDTDSRNAGGGKFLLGFVERENDRREGWFDPNTNRLMINLDHPLFIKYEKNLQARNQRIASIVTSALIKNAATKKSMTPVESFDLQTELLTMARDVMW